MKKYNKNNGDDGLLCVYMKPSSICVELHRHTVYNIYIFIK